MSSLESAEKIIRKLNDCGYIAYIAGGWVRDYLMNHPSDDIDIATNAPIEEIQALFAKTIPVGINFGIVIVVEDGHQYEVATFRKDEGYLDGRRPSSIQRATPEEDAQRRDFTINGLFYDPLHKKIWDYVGGQEDLKKGIIRAIGNPHERFLEDRLRMIRAVRYSSRFHFPIETTTMEAIYAHAAQLFPAVALERVWQEFVKMDRSPHFALSLAALHRLHLLPTIFPELAETPLEEVQSRLRHLAAFPAQTPTIVKILELFPSATLEEKVAVCDTFRLSRKEREFVEFYHKIESIQHLQLDLFDWAKLYAVDAFSLCFDVVVSKLKPDERQALIQAHQARIMKLEEAIRRIKSKSPIVRSQDLMQEGVKPGQAMGRLLEEAERLAANEAIEDPEALLKRLKNSPHWPS